MTVYCCGAVGGMLEHAKAEVQNGSNITVELVEGSNNVSEPLCMTSNYNDSK